MALMLVPPIAMGEALSSFHKTAWRGSLPPDNVFRIAWPWIHRWIPGAIIGGAVYGLSAHAIQEFRGRRDYMTVGAAMGLGAAAAVRIHGRYNPSIGIPIFLASAYMQVMDTMGENTKFPLAYLRRFGKEATGFEHNFEDYPNQLKTKK
eukprot:GABV01010353.1.p1 GENE.GABV01010353.1~~GABV01010353.1.p1  ORF type:complete len:149 (-),score=21.25 GABV01010353.1:25-471(-)